MQSLDTISGAVNTSLEKVNAKMIEEKKGRDALNDKYLALVEKERAYYKAAKEFQVRWGPRSSHLLWCHLPDIESSFVMLCC